MLLQTLILGLASGALAANQTFPDFLQSNPSTSKASEILQSAVCNGIKTNYTTATNFTCIVPANSAFEGVDNFDSSNSSYPNTCALFCVHGTYRAEDIPADGIFPHTFLESGTPPAQTLIQPGGAVLELRTEGNSTFLYSGINAASIYLKQNASGNFPNPYPGPKQKSRIVEANLEFEGGILHTVDTFITPPTASLARIAPYVNLEGLIALNSTGALPAFAQTPAFTVFILNNATYEEYEEDVLPKLNETEVQTLNEYYVINGTIAYADSFTEEGNSIATIGGQNVTLSKKNGTLYVNDIEVDVDDYLLATGVMHTLKGFVSHYYRCNNYAVADHSTGLSTHQAFLLTTARGS